MAGTIGPPLIEIGLTDLPKFGGAMAPPRHPQAMDDRPVVN